MPALSTAFVLPYRDLLMTVVMASRADVPVVVAPAMNTAMWDNPLVQRNVAALTAVDGGRRGRWFSPVEKALARGETGLGTLALPLPPLPLANLPDGHGHRSELLDDGDGHAYRERARCRQ